MHNLVLPCGCTYDIAHAEVTESFLLESRNQDDVEVSAHLVAKSQQYLHSYSIMLHVQLNRATFEGP